MSLEFVNVLKNMKNIALLIDEYHDDYDVSEKKRALNGEYHTMFKYREDFNSLLKTYHDGTFEYSFDCRYRYPIISNPDRHIGEFIPQWYYHYTPWINDQPRQD